MGKKVGSDHHESLASLSAEGEGLLKGNVGGGR
jgi:hypothetical protein